MPFSGPPNSGPSPCIRMETVPNRPCASNGVAHKIHRFALAMHCRIRTRAAGSPPARRPDKRYHGMLRGCDASCCRSLLMVPRQQVWMRPDNQAQAGTYRCSAVGKSKAASGRHRLSVSAWPGLCILRMRGSFSLDFRTFSAAGH